MFIFYGCVTNYHSPRGFNSDDLLAHALEVRRLHDTAQFSAQTEEAEITRLKSRCWQVLASHWGVWGNSLSSPCLQNRVLTVVGLCSQSPCWSSAKGCSEFLETIHFPCPIAPSIFKPERVRWFLPSSSLNLLLPLLPTSGENVLL